MLPPELPFDCTRPFTQCPGTGHRYVDERPLSKRRTENSLAADASLGAAVEAVQVVEVDVATGTIRLSSLPSLPALEQGMVLSVHTRPVTWPGGAGTASGRDMQGARGAIGAATVVRRFTVKQIKAPASFVVAETIGVSSSPVSDYGAGEGQALRTDTPDER